MIKDNYTNYINEITLDEEKRQEIYSEMRHSALQGQGSSTFTAVGERSLGRSKAKVAALSTTVIVVAAVGITAAVCILNATKNTNELPTGDNMITYDLGQTATDINGNTLCLDSVALSAEVTIDGQTYYSESGTFIIVGGQMQVEQPTEQFDIQLVTLSCYLQSATVVPYRSDLTSKYMSDEGTISGSIQFIFEADEELTGKINEYLTSESTANADKTFLSMDVESFLAQTPDGQTATLTYKITTTALVN